MGLFKFIERRKLCANSNGSGSTNSMPQIARQTHKRHLLIVVTVVATRDFALTVTLVQSQMFIALSWHILTAERSNNVSDQ